MLSFSLSRYQDIFLPTHIAWHKAMERIGRPEHMRVDIILMSWGTEEREYTSNLIKSAYREV